MGSPQITLDDKNLDNGSWRTAIGPLIVSSDIAGDTRTITQEFLIEGDDEDEITSRWSSTYADFTKLNPRIVARIDSESTDPAEDWIPGDSGNREMVSTVTVLEDQSQTNRKLHCLFTGVAITEVPRSTAGSTFTATGLLSEINIAKIYMESTRYVITASGRFGSTFTDDVHGPYNISSVSNNGGKARFTLSGSPSLPTFTQGMRISVTGTNGYDGEHIVTSIDDGSDRIETKTTFGSPESPTATLTIGVATSAQANYDNARDSILTTLLGTDTDGDPNATTKFALINEEVDYESERQDFLNFTLTAAEEAMISGVQDSGGREVQRGLSYTILVDYPDLWDSNFVDPPLGIIVAGRVSIREAALTEQSAKQWWDQIEATILAQVKNDLGGSNVQHRNTRLTIDYQTLDVVFEIHAVGNFRGVISYTQTTTFQSEKAFSIWEDTDGYDHLQMSPAPPRKMATINVSYVAQEGVGPSDPPPPTESGFTYILIGKGEAIEDNLISEGGQSFWRRSLEYRYIRLRQRGGDSDIPGGGGTLVGPPNP